MSGNLKSLHRFLLPLLFISGLSANATNLSHTWQEPVGVTSAINGTKPQADSVAIPVYQGSVQLSVDQANAVANTARPNQFSTDDSGSALILSNPHDTEGDIFAEPPLVWQSDRAPGVSLVWADAATPEVPLSPQPSANLSFCAQNMAGRHLVVWPQLDTTTEIPPLWLLTRTGVPYNNAVTLLEQKFAVDIAAAAGKPVAVSADHFNETLKAAKGKAGDSITLTVSTRTCDGEPAANTAFIITRSDAFNRQNAVNNTNPVHVGDTELTTIATEFHGTTDASGNATVTVTQDNSPGVKTTLTVKAVGATSLADSVDVIFTTLSSPDSDKAAMWGHMAESSSAEVEGETYTFTRPALAAEVEGESTTVNADNESWALFNWKGADEHCDILPDARQLIGLKTARGDLATTLGWPVAGDDEYWSATESSLSMYHYGVNMRSSSVVQEADTVNSLVSCVDKAAPAVKPKLVLSTDSYDSSLSAARVKVGEAVMMQITVTDELTGKPLPYRYFNLYLGNAQARNTAYYSASWEEHPVTIAGEGLMAGDTHHYQGVTDANGQASLEIKHDSGTGVLTPLRVVLFDGSTQATQNVIFTVLTSPDVSAANMWGHMQGVVEAGNLYKRPLLAAEATHKTGSTQENNENWATFNSVTAGENQCGSGQVPGQLSLDSLYNAHPDNEMQSEHGWPTASHSYLAADTSGGQTAHVNLATGADALFSGSEPNYLSCSGNELVTQLDVAMNGDFALRQTTAKVGEQITLTVRSINALNGLTVPNAAFTVTMAYGRNRDNVSTGFTDATNGALVIAGTAYGPSQASMTYQGTTDSQGSATLTIEQPQGVGLQTQLSILPMNSLISTPLSRSVKFTVPTSPDTAQASMWGHMPDTLTVGDAVFERPKLAAEVSATRTQKEANESWARVTHSDAVSNTDVGGCAVNRLPRIDQLKALYDANSGGAIHNTHGWPTLINYWSSTFATATSWKLIALSSGSEFSSNNASDYVTCLASDNPVAASITIEPVDSSLWYEGNNEHALKVKKGDTLQLKVTVKDASGKPIPDAPFVLSRGDGYTRQSDKHIAGSGDGIVSPVVIDGNSINDTATKVGGLTGADGSKIINVTRPDTHGTKVAVTAALYQNASVSASVDTIFTVVTSPDSNKAKMWGHMPETVSAANGKVFKRPQLVTEIASGIAVGNNTENNEIWATVDFEGIQNACGVGFVPALADLQSLYAAFPGGAINTQQGWPVEGKNYQNSTADISRSTENRYVKSLDLGDGNISSMLWNEKLYFSCLQTAQKVATRLTLTSSLYHADDGFVKAKVGETIPVVITTLDDEGNPVGNTPVIFKRGDSIGRKYQVVNTSAAAAIQINHSESRSSGIEYYSATNENGTLTLDISQDSGAGFKTPLLASLEHTSSATEQTLPVVFSVVTSPDTEKANYWGHMAETLTDRDGVVYKRPLLSSEFSNMPGKTVIITNGSYDMGETWGMITVSNAWNGVGGGCGRNFLPTASNLQALYATWPDGAMHSRNGWPMSSTGNVSASQYWWAGDYALPSAEGDPVEYAVVNLLSNGDVTSISNASIYHMQTCLVSPRGTAGNLTLTLAGQDETTGIVKVKKGEQIAATVTVKNTAGQPMANALVKLSRSESTTRSGSIHSAGSEDDITLRNVMPSGPATFLMDTSAKFLYIQTDEQGEGTFTLSQDMSAGLKTTLNATAMDGSNLTDSKDAIFTVITSPDSDKASMWGHMPETFVNSKGAEFNRPLLRAELSATTNTSGFLENSETWYTWNSYPQLYQQSASPCDRLGLPTLEQLQTLYNDYPNGTLSSTFGLPVTTGKYWGAGNSVPDSAHATNLFQYLRLSDNSKLATNMNTATAQLCLSKKRVLSIALTSSAMNAEKGAAVVRKGEIVPLTVTVTDGSGNPAPDTTIRLRRTSSLNRAGFAQDGNESNMLLTALTPEAGSMAFNCTTTRCNYYWYGVTDENGQAQFEIAQDNSSGLKTAIVAELPDDLVTSSNLDVIYTVLTSPDSDKANFWGHMPETVTNSAGVRFKRPLLATETSFTYSYTYNNESWALVTISNTQKAGATGCDAEYQPLFSDLQTLYADDPIGAIGTNYGWPVSAGKFWLAVDRVSKTGAYQYMRLDTGGKSSTTSVGTTGAQICLVDPHAPLPATIALTSSLADSETRIAKVKKGEEIPFTVTVKDANGNPAANASFTLSRSNGISRSGSVKTTDGKGATDDLVLQGIAPATAETVLSSNTSTWSGVTGADGMATLSLRQDDAMGLKTTITATLDTYPNPASTVEAIFTVVTSPDTDKAQYWGHMPETVTDSSGVSFQRPLLAAEVSAEDTTFSSTVGNELWPLYDHNGAGLASKSTCGEAWQPTLSELKSLYDEHPGGEIETLYGWPVSHASYGWWVTDKAGTSWQSMQLKTGAVSTRSTSDKQALVCLVDPHPMPGAITLTSTALNAERLAAQVKKGETIPLTVTVTDTDGNVMPDVYFTISRSNALSRVGNVITSGGADDLTLDELTPSAQTAKLATNTAIFSGLTGANGTATFNLRQDLSSGLKTTLTATVTNNTTLKASLDAIFTVITSPNSAKANYWGHMPETATTSDGVIFSRPLLAAEVSSSNTSYGANGELWSSVSASNLDKTGITGCDAQRQPLYSQLLTLYNDNQNGAVGTLYGWPITGVDNYWWAVDQDEATHARQALNLSNGQKRTTTSTSSIYRQVCLVNARE
ncbi:RatA homolog [Citrobacter europaeus]|uniref:adhesion domain-containing protein n=1 Tax=Citrobacter europaeus TaxID=1914243 RepID=UPI0008842B47|nr:DUF823 domain-containing adhesin [Citrobacter europaeus]UBI14819.1 DUF823 domain-containing adhesin [Citrobacter europaeus]CAD7561678.1 RatA homolog [Citrobacter europaeus]